MYDVNAVKRMIGKYGIDYAISVLSKDFSEETKAQLTKEYLLVGGYPNLTFIYSLAWTISATDSHYSR